ncbi:MAG TPA: glycerophosphodiester phosphodiesterase [Caldilineae bacterium]|nr:glycerophosphodiester phosphodiesterase [Caldilineae bacterium]
MFTYPSSRPLLFAHRGASAHAPENTLPAFALAAEMGADGVELDVQITADGKLIIRHDRVLGRTENADGAVRDWSFEDLRALDVGSWFDASFAGTQMPTPEEVVELAGNRLLLNFDVVNDSPKLDGVETLMVALFQRLNLFDRAMISSFNPRVLWSVRKQEPRIMIGATWGAFLPWYLRWGWWRRLLRPDALHPSFDLVTPELVARTHARGQRLHAWTVNEPADIARMKAVGVDMIMGDWVDRLVASGRVDKNA